MCFNVCPNAFVHTVLNLPLLNCCVIQTLMLSLLLSKAKLSCSVMLFWMNKRHVEAAVQGSTEEDLQLVSNYCRSGAGGGAGAGSGKPQFVSANAFRGPSSRRPTQVWHCPGYFPGYIDVCIPILHIYSEGASLVFHWHAGECRSRHWAQQRQWLLLLHPIQRQHHLQMLPRFHWMHWLC